MIQIMKRAVKLSPFFLSLSLHLSPDVLLSFRPQTPSLK